MVCMYLLVNITRKRYIKWDKKQQSEVIPTQKPHLAYKYTTCKRLNKIIKWRRGRVAKKKVYNDFCILTYIKCWKKKKKKNLFAAVHFVWDLKKKIILHTGR